MDTKKQLLFEKARLVIKEAEKLGAQQAQVSITSADTALTRLANSIIDQNVADSRAIVSIYLYYGKKQGSVRYEVFNDDDLIAAVNAASKIAKVSPESDDMVPLPAPRAYSTRYRDEDLLDSSTLNATPEQRAEYAMKAISTAHDVDKRIKAVAGAISHSIAENVLVNSLGIEAYEISNGSNITLTILAEDDKEETAGWCRDSCRSFGNLKVEEVSRTAAQKAAEGFGMKFLEPGDYEIILEPAAVGGFMGLMAYYTLSARAVQDYRSFLVDRIGEKVFSDRFTLWDDALDTRFTYPTKYDAEGFPKSKLDLVSDGVVKNIVYDSRTAAIDGVHSTGHNARFSGRSIPYPGHLIVQEGVSSLDEMVSETKHGILVTHFNYQNALDSTKGIFTGLTRDGAWYIKNGEIQFPLRTHRYTDAVPRFLGEIDLVGKYPAIRTSDAIVPALKLPSFRITGSAKE